jgi:hypothetical protein
MAAVSAVAVSTVVAASAVIAKQAVFMGEKRGANRAPFFFLGRLSGIRQTRAPAAVTISPGTTQPESKIHLKQYGQEEAARPNSERACGVRRQPGASEWRNRSNQLTHKFVSEHTNYFRNAAGSTAKTSTIGSQPSSS